MWRTWLTANENDLIRKAVELLAAETGSAEAAELADRIEKSKGLAFLEEASF